MAQKVLVIRDSETSSVGDNSGVESIYMESGARNASVLSKIQRYNLSVRSNIGIVREENQDNFGIYLPEPAIIVTDGMGGHQFGAEAAELVTRTVVRPSKKGVLGLGGENYFSLNERILEGDNAIKEYVHTHTGIIRGTEPGAAVGAVTLKNGILSAAYLGDVRIYVFDEKGQLKYMTPDESGTQLALLDGRISDEDEELIIKGEKISTSYILNCVDGEPNRTPRVTSQIFKIQPNSELTPRGRFKKRPGLENIIEEVKLKKGWKFMIASDGLHEYVTHQYICDRFTEGKSPAELTDILVDVAKNQCGGKDNITVAIGEYTKESKKIRNLN